MVKEIIIGTDLIDEIKSYDVILVGTTIKNALGNGFQHKIAINFRNVLLENEKTKYDDPRKLGTCKVVTTYQKEGFPIFVLCYITKGRYRPDKKPDALDYNALRSCLELVNEHFKGKKVAMTLMGNSPFEGGGDDKKIYEIIADTCDDIDLYIYDYIQEDYVKEDKKRFTEIVNNRNEDKITREEYEEKMKQLLWEENFGIYNKMPENVSLYELKKKIKEIKSQW